MQALELLLEEPSAKALLETLLPPLLPSDTLLGIHSFDGKTNLLKKLPQRLEGYHYYSPTPKIMVLVDRDDEDCGALKARLEKIVSDAGFTSLSTATAGGTFHVCTRIAVEELEAWILGDQEAVISAFPRVRPYRDQASYRDVDGIKGGTWEALERLLQKAGYYEAGLAKIDCAARIAGHLTPARNRSRSFHTFLSGMSALIGSESTQP